MFSNIVQHSSCAMNSMTHELSGGNSEQKTSVLKNCHITKKKKNHFVIYSFYQTHLAFFCVWNTIKDFKQKVYKILTKYSKSRCIDVRPCVIHLGREEYKLVINSLYWNITHKSSHMGYLLLWYIYVAYVIFDTSLCISKATPLVFIGTTVRVSK